MAKYRKLSINCWIDEKFIKLSTDEKLVALYLLTGPQTNRIGFFSFSTGMASDHLDINPNQLDTLCHTVCDTLFWKFLEVKKGLFVVHVPNWFKYNFPDNKNALLGALKDLDEVNKTPLIKPFFENPILQALFSRYGIVYPMPYPMPTQEQEQEQELKTKKNIKRKLSTGRLYSSKKEQKESAKRILEFLNETAERNFRLTDNTLKFILCRLNSGATEMQCRQVILKRCREWKNDELMQKYLRPETLFNATKFESYCGELVLPKGPRNE